MTKLALALFGLLIAAPAYAVEPTTLTCHGVTHVTCLPEEPVTEPPPDGGGGEPLPPSGVLFPQMGSQLASVVDWQKPGVTMNGGIPERPQCGHTLTPLGNGASDRPQILAAIEACPSGQRVQLGSGVFVLNEWDNITIDKNDITLRGMGPGPLGAIPNDSQSIPAASACGATPCTILYQANWKQTINSIVAINLFGASADRFGPSINLASDAAQGATSITLASAPSGPDWAVGRLAIIDALTADCNTGAPIWPTREHPELIYTKAFGSFPGDAWRYNFGGRFCRNIPQVVKITAVSGSTITLESPLSVAYTKANEAQLTPWKDRVVKGIGVEDIYVYGGGNGQGNISIDVCDSCWVKHVQSHWFDGPSVAMTSCYRCELRDSYLHESRMYKNTGSGGAGYLLALDRGTANSLIENNAIWNGNKQIVMRSSGGGNVIAYNYMDDAWGAGALPSQEAGANAGHFIGSHMELFEGNWSHKLSGDSWWGNAIYITAFRNQFSGMRGHHGWLNNFTSPDTHYVYCDCWARGALTMQTYSYWYNIVGNIFGYDGQTLLDGQLWLPASDFRSRQVTWRYEAPDSLPDDGAADMYQIGTTQDNSGFPTDPTLHQKTNRQGNYDFVTKSQIWYNGVGGKGEISTGQALEIPQSLYLKTKPAFFGAKPWPWVHPEDGRTDVLPAKYCFEQGKMPTCLK